MMYEVLVLLGRSRNPWSMNNESKRNCYRMTALMDESANIDWYHTEPSVRHLYDSIAKAKTQAEQQQAAAQAAQPKQAKTDRKSHYKRPQQQNEFNYTSKRCTRYTDTQIHGNRYTDCTDTQMRTHTDTVRAVAGLKSLQKMERRRRRRSTRVFWCLQARNWIKLKTKRNWKHTHKDTVLYICVCVYELFIFC